MRKFLAIGLAILSLAAVYSCRRGSRESTRPADLVKFTVSLNGFDVKATDNAFEAGDAVGVFAGDPINAANERAAVSGNSLSLDNRLFWGEGQTQSTTFAAYLPYDASLTSATTSFAVKPDQTSYADYQASDLRASVVTSEPHKVVAFSLKHQLSKLIVIPTCEDASETVTGVTVQELVTEAAADISAGTLTAGTAKGTVKAGAAVSGNGGQGYVCILVPQTVKLQLAVTTSLGRSLDFSLDQPQTMAPGTAYRAEIKIPVETVPVPATPAEFTISIVDWDSPEDLTFMGNEDYQEFKDGKWSVIGIINGTNWDSDIWMTETSTGVWEVDITYPAGGAFKLRQDGAWSTETEVHAEAGMPDDATDPVPGDGSEYGLWASGGKDIFLPTAGEYHLKFVEDGYLFYATLTSAPAVEITELYLLGAATDTGWNLAAMPQFTRSGNVFTLSANLKPNEKFRFPLQKEDNVWWPCLVRGDAEGTVKIGDSDDNDEDQFTVAEDGYYEIVVDVEAMTVSITRKGDRVAQAIEVNELYLLGGATDAGWSLADMPQLEKSGNVFSITAHLKAGVIGTGDVFRFPLQKVANVWWPCLVKGDAEGTIALGTSDGDQDRQFTVNQTGTYAITIDVAAMTISIVLQSAD